MDQGQRGNRTTGTLPRLSRLPKILPQASHDNLRLANASKLHDPVKSSGLPRPSSTAATTRAIAPVPLGESLNRSVKERYPWSSSTTQSQARSRSPVRDALQAATATLDTTPPSSGSHLIIHDDDENGNAAVDEKQITDSTQLVSALHERRKPRLSLSERTVETLASISPSPSPTRRRSSMATHDGLMGPPLRPASRMRDYQNPSVAPRSPSPNKQTFRPPGRNSPSKEPRLPVVTSPGSIYTPPRAFVKGGNARYTRSVIGGSKTVQGQPGQIPSSTMGKPLPSKITRPGSTTVYSSKKPTNSSGSAALEALFRDPGTVTQNPGGSQPSETLRSRSLDHIASPPTPSKTTGVHPERPVNVSSSRNFGVNTTDSKTPKVASSKSSATLRDTIARAKAVKRGESPATTARNAGRETTHGATLGNYEVDPSSIAGQGSLRKRLQTAVVTGSLSLAAMSLTSIPHEVMSMYETTTGSISWSEMVDLTKLNAADNKLEHIGEDVLPDWSVEELYNDDEKANQFAGLESLDLHNNLLPSMPVGLRRLEQLRTLKLSGNKLTNQVLTVIWQIPNLQNLHLAHNSLTGIINLSTIGTEQLRKLDLSHNQLTEVELAEGQVKTLQSLDVSANMLTTLPWHALAMSELFELKAAGNRLHGTALGDLQNGLSKLIELDLSQNAISTLGAAFSALTSLRTCALSGNSISSIPDMSLLQSLMTFQVSENKLEEIPASMYGLASLRNLDMSQNSIRTLQAQVAGMANLTTFNVAGNPLRERKYLNMTTADLKLDLQKRLELSSPTGNRDATSMSPSVEATTQGYIFSASKGLLDLSAHGLTSVDLATIDFETDRLPVHTLRLTNNDLTALPEELLRHPALATSLRSLDISHNPRLHSTKYITSEIHLPALQHLYVVSTGLTSLDALTVHLKAPSLVELNISCHRLAGALPDIRRWYPSCTTLLASDNWFSSVEAASVEGLEVLDIRNNQIEFLSPVIGLLGNQDGKREAGRLRVLEVAGNVFRVPRILVVEKGTEAVLRDLRRMVPLCDVPEEWQGAV